MNNVMNNVISTELARTALIKWAVRELDFDSGDIWVPSGINPGDVECLLTGSEWQLDVKYEGLIDFQEGPFEMVVLEGNEEVARFKGHKFYHGGPNSGSWFKRLEWPVLTRAEYALVGAVRREFLELSE